VEVYIGSRTQVEHTDTDVFHSLASSLAETMEMEGWVDKTELGNLQETAFFSNQGIIVVPLSVVQRVREKQEEASQWRDE